MRDSSYNYSSLPLATGAGRCSGEENITDEFELVWQDGLMFTEVGRAATSLGLSLWYRPLVHYREQRLRENCPWGRRRCEMASLSPTRSSI